MPKKVDNDKWIRSLFGIENKNKTRYKQIQKIANMKEKKEKACFSSQQPEGDE